jgi:quinohemoprotein ethanol dehydrogenase
MKTKTKLLLPFTSILLIAGCKQAERGSPEHLKMVTSAIDDNRLINADNTPGDWLSYGRNYAEDRYSTLEQINKGNIKNLGLAWSLTISTTLNGIETTPIVVDGIMYFTGPWSKVYAANAVTGQMLWTYDPQVPGYYGQKLCCDVVNRGVAVYKGRVYVGAIDGRLISLDASNGKPVWEIMTVDTTKPYSITGAPRVVDGKVIIGNGGAELGVRGYITAYDPITGKQLWRFFTVPGDPSKPFESEAVQIAAKTWTGKWWEYGGGGTVWDAMAYDPGIKLLYIGTGNGSPWNRYHRSPGGGDNLFLSSIIAINPDNGKMVWYYQTTPGDTWDFTATQHLILADITIKGQLRKVIMQAPKNGIFYVLDRTNGKLISAKPYTFINWATGIDSSTGRPIETDYGRFVNKNAEIFPGPLGAHSWHPMAFNEKTQLVYLPVRDVSMLYGNDLKWKYNQPSAGFGSGIYWNTALGYDSSKPLRKEINAPKIGERLAAWDPINQREVWSVPHKYMSNGGVLTTSAQLVFEGTSDGRFMAFDAADGKVLWQKDLGTGIIAAPVTYQVGDTQYISIAVGWGGVMGKQFKFTEQINPGTVYTFALNKNQPMPVFPKAVPKKLIDMPFTATSQQIQHGSVLFNQYCGTCHSDIGTGGGTIPDLGYSSKAIHGIFKDILLKGLLINSGMPNFSGRLSESDIADIQNYILATVRNQAGKQKKTNNKTKL